MAFDAIWKNNDQQGVISDEVWRCNSFTFMWNLPLAVLATWKWCIGEDIICWKEVMKVNVDVNETYFYWTWWKISAPNVYLHMKWIEQHVVPIYWHSVALRVKEHLMQDCRYPCGIFMFHDGQTARGCLFRVSSWHLQPHPRARLNLHIQLARQEEGHFLKKME